MNRNMPALSSRAKRALDILADGGRFAYRLERNSYTGREQFQHRLIDSNKIVVAGIGSAAFRELDRAMMLYIDDRFSTATYYGLRGGKAERIAGLRIAARGPGDGWEYAGWEADARRAADELEQLTTQES